jgi:ankyrin repeat protein
MYSINSNIKKATLVILAILPGLFAIPQASAMKNYDTLESDDEREPFSCFDCVLGAIVPYFCGCYALSEYRNGETTAADDIFRNAIWQGRILPAWIAIKLGITVERDIARHGQTALYYSCRKNRPLMVSFLLSQGAKVDTRDLKLGKTPLHVACEKDYLSIVKRLCAYRAPLEALTTDGSRLTPLHLACEKGHFRIVRYLVELGNVNIESQTSSGDTPIVIACLNKHHGIVKYLVNKNAQIGVHGELLLKYACSAGDLDMVTYLLKFIRVTKDMIAWAQDDQSFATSFNNETQVDTNTREKIREALSKNNKYWNEQKEHRGDMGQLATNTRAIFENLVNAKRVDLGFTYANELKNK